MKKILFISLLISLFVLACKKDDSLPSQPLALTIKVITANNTPPRSISKSGQTTNEVAIDDIQVLVFENDAYSYRIQGGSLHRLNDKQMSFKALLRPSTQKITLHLLANTHTYLQDNEPSVGASIETVKLLFNKTIDANALSGSLVMWGTIDLPDGISENVSTTIPEIYLLRHAARIDITATNAPNFHMVSIQAFRVANKSQLIPNHASTSGVNSPSIPNNTLYTINTNPISIVDDASLGQLYLPESAAPSLFEQATCLVIGGYFTPTFPPIPSPLPLTYYRIDFDPDIEGHFLGQILRNHRYQFNILQVGQDGKSTAQEAADSPPIGIVGSWILWKDHINEVHFNDLHFFGLSQSKVSLEASANSSVTIMVETDTPDFTFNWIDQSGNLVEPSSADISQTDIRVRKIDDTQIEITALTENPVEAPERQYYVLITAGTLKVLLSIEQAVNTSGPWTVDWAPANVDRPGTFASSQGEPGMFYQWNRPVGWSVTGAVTNWNAVGASGMQWEIANSPCPEGWRIPTDDELEDLAKSPGRRWRNKGAAYPNQGVWFAASQAEADNATLANPNNALFFPAVGARDLNGNLYNEYSNGYYWGSNLDVANNTYLLSIASGTYFVYAYGYRANGFLIRCVR